MQTEQLLINGMTCGGCVKSVTHALLAIDGVHNVDVSLESGMAVVQFDEQLNSTEHLARAVRSAGYTTTSSESRPSQRKRHGCCG